MKVISEIVNELKLISGDKHVITSKWGKEPFSKGWRYGGGETLAIVKPGTLLEIWKVLQKCVEYDLIVIMQAANTGLTGGSTPFGKGYDRSIIVVNTLRIKSIQIIDSGNQIIALAGSSLYDLENILKPLEKEPHSVIGSTSIVLFLNIDPSSKSNFNTSDAILGSLNPILPAFFGAFK